MLNKLGPTGDGLRSYGVRVVESDGRRGGKAEGRRAYNQPDRRDQQEKRKFEMLLVLLQR